MTLASDGRILAVGIIVILSCEEAPKVGERMGEGTKVEVKPRMRPSVATVVGARIGRGAIDVDVAEAGIRVFSTISV